MLQKTQKFMLALAAVAAIGVGSAVIANAASSGTAQMQPAASGGSHRRAAPRQNEDALTGDTADKVRAAALDKVPGGAIIRLETDAGPAAYEAHVRKSDGTEVIVLVNSSFEVIDVVEGGPGARGGPGGHDGRPCDRDGDGNGNPDSRSGSSQDQGTGTDGGGSSNQI